MWINCVFGHVYDQVSGVDRGLSAALSQAEEVISSLLDHAPQTWSRRVLQVVQSCSLLPLWDLGVQCSLYLPYPETHGCRSECSCRSQTRRLSFGIFQLVRLSQSHH